MRVSAIQLIGGEESGCVCTDFVEAATLGIAKTEVYVSELQISQLYEEADTDPDELPILEDYGLDELVSEPFVWPEEAAEAQPATVLEGPVKEGYYRIPQSYWGADFDSNDIDWRSSTISISPTHIVPLRYIESDKTLFHIKDGAVINVALYVVHPDFVLSKTSEIPPVLTRALIEQLKGVRPYFWTEITAATWRILAEGPEDKHGLEAHIIRVLRDYMRHHGLHEHEKGLEPSESAMKSVVGKILQQWRTQDAQSRVLVSSTARVMPHERTKGQSA
jgi:hypothetical protein